MFVWVARVRAHVHVGVRVWNDDVACGDNLIKSATRKQRGLSVYHIYSGSRTATDEEGEVEEEEEGEEERQLN